MTLLTLGSLILRRSGLILLLGFVVALAMGLPALFKARTYTTTATFAPQSSNNQFASMNGLAAQLGVSVPSVGAQSPDFYAQLIESRGILTSVAQGEYSDGSVGAKPKELADVLHIKGASPRDRLDATIRWLHQAIIAEAIAKTGTVQVSVTAPSPQLADQIANRLLDLLNSFNLETKQTQAAAETKFVEGRLAEVRAELRRAEDELQQFLQVNRQLGAGQMASPELNFSRDRLQQEVQLKRGLFNTLSQAYEQSRIEEVRNTPVITVFEQPDMPVHPDSRRVVVKTLLGFMFGSLVGVITALLLERVRWMKETESEEFAQFLVLRRRAAENLLHPWRSVGRLLRRA